jgi:hypothetical protein
MKKQLEDVRSEYQKGNLSRRDFVKYLGVRRCSRWTYGGTLRSCQKGPGLGLNSF